MTEKIEATLRRLAAATSRVPDVPGAPPPRPADQLGDPDCPHCHGVGYLRQDLPVGHPDFGKLEICTCRQPEVQARLRDQLFRLSRLEELRHLTFDTFAPQGRGGLGERESDSVQRAHDEARRYASERRGWLLLQGDFGCGKTHLAAAIANACVAQGIPSLFLTVPDLLDALRFAYQDGEISFEDRFEQIRRAPMLILDDFGTQNATEWAREKLFQLLNQRYINREPLVITTNLSPEELDGRMRSRFSDPALVTTVHILAPDYRRPGKDTRQYELSSLPLHRDKTFSKFSLREGETAKREDLANLREAFHTARTFAERPSGWLAITGRHRTGKTHLAAAIANYRMATGDRVMFVTAIELLDHLRATFAPDSRVTYDRLFGEIRLADLLVIDNLGAEATTAWAREKLYQLFDYRYVTRLPTVITSVYRLHEFDKLDQRLAARLTDPQVTTEIVIQIESYSGNQPRPRRRR